MATYLQKVYIFNSSISYKIDIQNIAHCDLMSIFQAIYCWYHLYRKSFAPKFEHLKID